MQLSAYLVLARVGVTSDSLCLTWRPLPDNTRPRRDCLDATCYRVVLGMTRFLPIDGMHLAAVDLAMQFGLGDVMRIYD